jgi:hypothetical protein
MIIIKILKMISKIIKFNLILEEILEYLIKENQVMIV